jgi:predicted nucleic acid-binding protein
MERVREMDMPYGFSAFTYMELLRGVKTKKEFVKLKEYLSTQTIYCLPERPETYGDVAYTYFDLRRKGVTPRNTVDLFIAFTAMTYDLFLLHDDKDFDNMAPYLPELKIFAA